MRRGISISGLSILLALGLAAWEVYFFWFGGKQVLGSLHGPATAFRITSDLNDSCYADFGGHP